MTPLNPEAPQEVLAVCLPQTYVRRLDRPGHDPAQRGTGRPGKMKDRHRELVVHDNQRQIAYIVARLID